jgi:hypothetical protein
MAKVMQMLEERNLGERWALKVRRQERDLAKRRTLKYQSSTMATHPLQLMVRKSLENAHRVAHQLRLRRSRQKLLKKLKHKLGPEKPRLFRVLAKPSLKSPSPAPRFHPRILMFPHSMRHPKAAIVKLFPSHSQILKHPHRFHDRPAVKITTQ